MAKLSNTVKRKIILRKLDTHHKRLAMIYGWIKDSHIDFGQFKELLEYLEVVDDLLDEEFTAARLKALKERERKLQESGQA